MRKVKRNGKFSWAKCLAVMTAAALLTLCCAGLIACGGHTHNLAKVAGKAATCTEAGSKDYWTCDGCDVLFADADASKTITAEEIAVAAKGHTLGKVNAVAATCTAEGHSAYWQCSACDALFADAEGKTATTLDAVKTDKAAHTIVAVGAEDATCIATGVRAHYKCSACDALFADAEGKTAVTIEDVTIGKTAHAYELKVTVAPGIYLVGTTLAAEDLTFSRQCAVCGDTVAVTDGVTVDLTAKLVAGENTFTAAYDGQNVSFKVTAASMTELSVTDSKVTTTNSDKKKIGLKEEGGQKFLSGSPDNYYGRLFTTYNLSVEEDTQIKLYLKTCIREYEDKNGNRIEIKMNDVYSIKVNGRELTVGDDVGMPQAVTAAWLAHSYTCAGEATLLAGQNNVVEITRKNLLAIDAKKEIYGRYTYNFFGIGVASNTDAEITHTELCAHVCPHCGKCTDTDPENTNPMCAEKCAGHENEHFCEHVCDICGACRDAACEDPVCAEKCGCVEFAVTHKSVTKVDDKGAAVTNKKPGEPNISANDSTAGKGMIKITYTIVSDINTTAKLYIRTCSQKIENSLADSFSFKAGETPVTVDGDTMMPYNEANNWNDIRYTYVGEVSLIAGTNTIEITRPDMTDRELNDYTGYNFFGIALSGDGTFAFPA